MSNPPSGDDLPGAHYQPPDLASGGMIHTATAGSWLPDSGQGGSAHTRRGVREHPGEFELVQQQRARFDASAWRAAIAGRARMPRLTAETFDPGPDVLAKVPGQLAMFLADGAEAAEVRPVTTAEPILGGVATVEVTGRSSFLPGTLVVRISPDSTRDVDPRTLRLVRWDSALRRPVLLQAAGTNLKGGYVFARITHPGLYTVVGLPMPAVLNRAQGVLGLGSTQAFDLIITRLFAPEGPWTSLGPHHLSCCIFDLAIDPANNDRIYCAASDGGIWRLDSLAAYPGTTWIPLTDQQPSLEINCLAVSPADSQVVYYVDRLGNLYRSANRGDSWTLTGSTNLGNARRLLAHPSDANTIYVASDSGLWCSHTGGASWAANPSNMTLLDGDMTDVALDPGNPDIIYLTQRLVGLLKSSTGGGAWQVMLPWSSATAPSGSMIKVAVGGQGTDASRTVAVKFDQQVFVNHFGGRGPSVLGGGPWTSINNTGDTSNTGYGDWCHVLAIDPFNDNVILAGAQRLYRTHDGGQNWAMVINYYAPHEDQHRVLFDPTQPNVVYAANDGGVFRSSDDGVTWQTSGDDLHAQRDLTLGLVTAQFYTCAVSGDHAAGDAYHQGNLSALSLAAADWIGGGHAWEFANIFGDPVRAGRYFIFGSTLFQYLFPGTGTASDLVSISTFQPTAIAVDQRPGSTVVLAGTSGGQVMRAPDGDTSAPTWTAMAGMTLPPNDVIVWMDFAPSRPQQVYALSSAGEVFVCTDVDALTTWTSATGLPDGYGRAIAVTVEQESHLFAISSSRVFRSIDGGGSWTSVPGTGLHQLPPALDLRSITTGPGALYLAASAGVFVSHDEGENWFPYSDGLPNVELKELLWTQSDLFAVTHGRGLWHHGRYDYINIPPIAHVPDIPWLIQLWLAIHGGDPAPDAIRSRIGRGFDPLVRAGEIGMVGE